MTKVYLMGMVINGAYLIRKKIKAQCHFQISWFLELSLESLGTK